MTARRIRAIALLALLVSAPALGACGRETRSSQSETRSRGGSGGRGGRGGMAFPVEVAPVANRSVEYAVNAVGSVAAFEIVQVTARVAGAVERIHFREGERVGKGTVLVEIEPQRYRLLVEEAKAARDRARAQLEEAEAGLSRRSTVNDKTPGLIPGEEVDAWRTRVSTARADLAAREASLALAERNARDALARAPFAGTIQTRDIQTGIFVQQGTLLTTLVRRDPLLLRFQVPEGDAARIRTGMKARFRVREDGRERWARIVHVGDAADPTSRMVAVTSEILKDDGRLRPGSFAEVSVPVGGATRAAVVPETAVRPGERGFMAYVVQAGVAHERIVTLGLRTSDRLVEVRSGLAPGESLVVRGGEALSEGARVRVVDADPKGAAARGRATSTDSTGRSRS